MKLQFDPNQDYQKDAIDSVVRVFEGQPQGAGGFAAGRSGEGSGQGELFERMVVENRLMLEDEQVVRNVQAVQRDRGLDVGGDVLGQGHNFTVEMETGTGKTYVYLRTIHELHRTYGFKKFIIVVPSVAIREGVLKNLQITKEHFDSLYTRPEMNFYVWDAKKRGQAKQFALTNALQIMVINIDSFTKGENIIRQDSDWGVPLEFIRATRPIVVIDEPQNMETEIRKQAIADLNPLCTLRYSATHKNYYNLLYKLDPVKAYDLGLVKKIEVDSVVSAEAYNDAYVKLLKISHKTKRQLVAHVEIDKGNERGLQRKIVKLEPGDDLERITKREVYAGYVLDEISVTNQYITFTNHKKLEVGQQDQGLQEAILQYQIRRTVENHFEKELRLRQYGIKVLSLFFIDAVAHYRQYGEQGVQKGKFARWFEEAFSELARKPEYQGLISFTAEQVHNGYFAQDKDGRWKDSRDTKGEGAKSKDDESAYHLIMQAKEKLLDGNQPLRFIFSHSALREGWDNPNVFQICTLREMNRELERRQTIGRGLRLPVDATGKRIYDESINILTVIANEDYETFARNLQTEMETQTGVSFGAGQIKRKPDYKTVPARKHIVLNQDFKALWDKIKHKTRYQVTFATDLLVEKVVRIAADEVIIRPPKIVSHVTQLSMTEKAGMSGHQIASKGTLVAQDFPVPDVAGKIAGFTGLTRQTAFDILDRSSLLADILTNPQQVIDDLTRIIKIVMQALNVDGIKYQKTGDVWDMRRFENDELSGYLFDEAGKQGLVAIQSSKTTHDYVAVDSDIERKYLEALEDNRQVSFYCKLPGWFKIDTPLGGYTPDWAVVFNGDERVYFVAETKAENTLTGSHLTDTEKGKILSARGHFKTLGVAYIAPTNSLGNTLERLAD